MQNTHLNWTLMGHKKNVHFISNRSPNSEIYLEGILNFYFSSNFDAVFSLNWLCRELPAVCQQISSISYGYRIPKCEPSYFKSNFNAVFCKMNNFYFLFLFLFVSSIVRNLHSYKSPYITTWHGCTRIYNIIIMWLLHFIKVN